MNNDAKVTVQHDGFEPAKVQVFMNADGAVRAYLSFSSHLAAWLGQGTALPKTNTYHIGQRFKFNDGIDYAEYMLAATSLNAVILVCTKSGKHWMSSITVSNPAKITEEELAVILGTKFLYFSEVSE